MKQMHRILVVDDHPLLAGATAELLRSIPGVEISAVAGSGAECLAAIEQEVPDVIILDFSLPDRLGDELAAEILSAHPQVAIIIFTPVDLADLYNRLIELGVSGILSKESSPEVIRLMVIAVLQGHTLLPQAYFRKLRLIPDSTDEKALTDDEVHIMNLVIRGATNEAIALDIQMSKRSVDNYLKRIYDKLGVRARAQAVERFLQLQQKKRMR